MEAVEDANTISLLKEFSALDGYNCLEVGAGCGSIATWLSNAVGESGTVIATDIEPTHLSNAEYEVLRHDIQHDPMPDNYSDLIQMRHVLIHLKEPVKALCKMFLSTKVRFTPIAALILLLSKV